jgi:hypothetical protein
MMTDRRDKTPARQRQSAPRGQPRSRGGAPGIKALITAASVAATLGGWALLAQGMQPASMVGTSVSGVPTAAAERLNLPPVPTVVPAPDPTKEQTETGPRVPSLRSVTTPRTVRAPIAITRSSR